MTRGGSSAVGSAGDVLVVRGARVRLGGAEVLRGVGLTVAPGSFTGLIGANGAGKTTLLRLMLGTLRASGGSVTRPRRRREGGIGYLPQKIALDADAPLRARDVVALGLDGGRIGIPLPDRERRRRVDEALMRVGADGFADHRIGELSGGQQQRVLRAHAIISRPVLLLLDEPLASLDPASARDIVDLLDQLRRETGVAVVMTAHDLTLLLPVLDVVAYIVDGIAAVGAPDTVVREDVLTALYGRPIRVVRADGQVFVIASDADRYAPAPAPPAADAPGGGA